jgi:hypothetical protein
VGVSKDKYRIMKTLFLSKWAFSHLHQLLRRFDSKLCSQLSQICMETKINQVGSNLEKIAMWCFGFSIVKMELFKWSKTF